MSSETIRKEPTSQIMSMKAPRELRNLLDEFTRLGIYNSKSAFLRSAILKELDTLALIIDVYLKLQKSEKQTNNALRLKTATELLSKEITNMEDYIRLNELLLRTFRKLDSNPDTAEMLLNHINLVKEVLEK